MSEVYYFLAAISYGIFLIQFILSWFGGETDLDVDLDGELDMDVGDIVSFKGFVHFIMGASGWLSVRQFTSNSLEWYDYIIAIIIGIVFIFVLFYLYKLCLKLQYQPKYEEGNSLVGKSGTILVACHGQYYYLKVEINGCSEEIIAYPEISNVGYTVGTSVTISKFINNKYYFK